MQLLLILMVILIPLPVSAKIFNLGFGINIYNILLLLILVGWFFRKGGKSGKVFLSTPLNKPIFIFIVISIYSFILSYFVDSQSLIVNFFYLYPFIFFILLYFVFLNNVQRIKHIKTIILLIIIMCICVAFISYKQRTDINAQSFSWDLKTITGTFLEGSNEAGAFFAQYIPLMLAFALFSKSIIKKIVLSLSSFYCSVILMWTYSRGAWYAFLGSLLFLGIAKDKKILVLVLILLIFKSIILPPSVVDRTSIYAEGGKLEHSAQIREELWREGVHALKMPKYAIFGMGLNQAQVYLERSAHNTYLKFAMESGLFGLGIFLWILFISFKEGWKLYKSAKDDFCKGLALGFLACLVSLSLVNFTGTRLMIGSISAYFWILMGLMSRTKIMIDEKN